MKTELPEGTPVVRIPVDQITIREASDLVEDGDSYWLATMPAVLQFYPSITPGIYWDLTVGEHRSLVAWLHRNGIVTEADTDGAES